jgi:uncharacterized protein
MFLFTQVTIINEKISKYVLSQNNKFMNILITGASGLIGRNLVKRLTELHHEITVFSRTPGNKMDVFPEGTKVIEWDYRSPSDWENILNQNDVVIHLAGANLFARRWDDSYKKKIIDSRETSSRNIVKAIKKNDTKLKLLISASGIGYYGETDSIGVDEAAPSGNDFLAEVCRKWEEPTYKADEKNIRRINMRMGLVLSTEDGYLSKLLPAYKLFAGGPLGSSKSWLSWVHIDDVVNAYIFAIENISISGIINLTTPNPVTSREFSSALGRVLRRPSFFTVPETAIKVMVGEGAKYVTYSQKVFPGQLKNCGFSFRYPEIETALKDLITNKK